MQPTSHHCDDDSYEIWMTAMAIKRGDTSSEHSVERLKREIRQNLRIIKAAKEKAKTL
jgi:hypothetical protein